MAAPTMVIAWEDPWITADPAVELLRAAEPRVALVLAAVVADVGEAAAEVVDAAECKVKL